jgi:hypothetical protein
MPFPQKFNDYFEACVHLCGAHDRFRLRVTTATRDRVAAMHKIFLEKRINILAASGIVS